MQAINSLCTDNGPLRAEYCIVAFLTIQPSSFRFFFDFFLRGRFFTGDNVMWHRPLGSIAVGCCSRAVTPLLWTKWSLLLRHPMLFNGPDNPQIAPFCGASGPHLMHGSSDTHDLTLKRHRDRFSRFCPAPPCGAYHCTADSMLVTEYRTHNKSKT